MILVVSQLLFPLLAVLCLNKIADAKDKKILFLLLKNGLLQQLAYLLCYL